MAGNANYRRGVRFERERLHYYQGTLKQVCLRTAGSHGAFDLVAINNEKAIVTLIQCKVVQNPKLVQRMLTKFREAPPLTPMKGIHQTLEIKVTGSTEVHSVTI